MIRTSCLAVALVVLLALVGSIHGARAQANCTNDSLKAAGDCFNKLLDQANTEMQARYQSAQAVVKDQSQFAALLAKSQDAWLVYRSQTCDNLVAPYWQQGVLQGVAVTSCKLALTRERASDLQNLFQGLWGLQQ